MLGRNKTLLKPLPVAIVFLGTLGMGASAFGKHIKVKNTSDTNTIVVSDLTVYSGQHRNGTAQVVLVANDNTDDVTLGPGEEQVFNVDKDGKALMDWKSYEVSHRDDKGEHRGLPKGGSVTSCAMFTPDVPTDLYTAICDNVEVPDDEIFTVIDGEITGLPEYFASESTFGFVDDNCTRDGTETPFSGTITSVVTLQVTPEPAPIPTLSEWAAIGMAVLLLTAGAIVFFRVRRGKTAAA